jgi:hypothetical protein
VSRDAAPLFLNFGTGLGRVVKATPLPLYPGERNPLSILQEAGWAPGRVLTYAKNLALTGIRFLELGLSELAIQSYIPISASDFKCNIVVCLDSIYFASTPKIQVPCHGVALHSMPGMHS